LPLRHSGAWMFHSRTIEMCLKQEISARVQFEKINFISRPH
jgi:hypothetical protein